MALILYCPCVNTLFKIASLVYRKLDEGKSDSEDDGSESYDSHNDENNSKHRTD